MPSVLVSGSSTGIGRETALRLDGAGYRVFAGVRRGSDGEALRQAASERLTPLLLDVTDSGSIELAVKSLAAQLDGGGLRGLVNNAGIAVFGPMECIPPEELRRPFDVNVFGTTALTQALLPLLHESKGRVINVSSGSGRVSTPMMGPYSASKYALEALSDALRSELRRFGVDVVVIEPGGMQTPLIGKEQAQLRELLGQLPPRGRERYGRLLERFLEVHDKMGSRTASPQKVAAAIQRALEARRPRTRYAVGTDTRAILVARWLLPDRALDWIFLRAFGLAGRSDS